MMAWRVQESQKEHQQARPEGMVAGYVNAKVPAHGRPVASVFSLNHFDPRLLSATMLAAETKEKAGAWLPILWVLTTVPSDLAYSQAQIAHQEQSLSLPQQPVATTPYWLLAHSRPSDGYSLPQPQQPGPSQE
jgi:hypothetical protein